MVTLKEIAERCEVSPTTVSNVINGKAKTSEETRQKILQVIDETGYKPNVIAKGLRLKSSKIRLKSSKVRLKSSKGQT